MNSPNSQKWPFPICLVSRFIFLWKIWVCVSFKVNCMPLITSILIFIPNLAIFVHMKKARYDIWILCSLWRPFWIWQVFCLGILLLHDMALKKYGVYRHYNVIKLYSGQNSLKTSMHSKVKGVGWHSSLGLDPLPVKATIFK